MLLMGLLCVFTPTSIANVNVGPHDEKYKEMVSHYRIRQEKPVSQRRDEYTNDKVDDHVYHYNVHKHNVLHHNIDKTQIRNVAGTHTRTETTKGPAHIVQTVKPQSRTYEDRRDDFTQEHVYHHNVHRHDRHHHDIDKNVYYHYDAGHKEITTHHGDIPPSVLEAIRRKESAKDIVDHIDIVDHVIVPQDQKDVTVHQDVIVHHGGVNHEHYPVHCNPNSKMTQICPGGHQCTSSLECIKDSRGVEYCICPRGTVEPGTDANVVPNEIHCDPNSKIVQICPNGQLCSDQVLKCEGKYCICPLNREQAEYANFDEEIIIDIHSPKKDTVIDIKFSNEVHCNPDAEFSQICPNGQTCNLSMDCKTDDIHHILYCICPTHTGEHVTPAVPASTEVHCDPNSKIPQICPNGHLCSRDLPNCNSDYCVCPVHHHH